MSLINATLAELAKKRAGVGPARSKQTGSPFTVFPNTAPAISGDGVDSSSALLSNVLIDPTGGTATFTIWGRSTGAAEWQELDGWKDIVVPAGVFTKYRVLCESEDELYVRLESTTAATSVGVWIEPCNG